MDTLKEIFTAIADAIRNKSGGTKKYKPADMAEAISAISGSGVLAEKAITENGTYMASDDSADGYSKVTVNVESSGDVTLVEKEITENGTYNPTDDSANGYSKVVVDVPQTGGSQKTGTTGVDGIMNFTLFRISIQNATLPIKMAPTVKVIQNIM